MRRKQDDGLMRIGDEEKVGRWSGLGFARRKPKDGTTQSGSGDKEKEARECERREGKHARSGIRSLEEPLRLE